MDKSGTTALAYAPLAGAEPESDPEMKIIASSAQPAVLAPIATSKSKRILNRRTAAMDFELKNSKMLYQRLDVANEGLQSVRSSTLRLQPVVV